MKKILLILGLAGMLAVGCTPAETSPVDRDSKPQPVSPEPEPEPEPDPEPEPEPVFNPDFDIYLMNPLKNQDMKGKAPVVFKDTLRVARGETATVQVAIVASKGAVSDMQISCLDFTGNSESKIAFGKALWEHYLKCSVSTSNAEVLNFTNNMYPDPLTDDAASESIPSGECRPIWVEVDIPRDAQPGLCEGKLRVKANVAGQTSEGQVSIFIRVYPVTLPEEQTLSVVQWYHTGHFKALNGGENVTAYSELYYGLMEKLSKICSEYGQNCWQLREWPEVTGLTADGKDFEVDFTQYDRTVQTFIQHGNLRAIHQVINDKVSYIQDGELKTCTIYGGKRVGDWRFEQYVKLLYPKFVQHLKDKGWWDMFYQHIIDECNDRNTWESLASLFREVAPDIRFIEAGSDIENWSVDIPVECLNSGFDSKGPVPEGKERWIYVCDYPVGTIAQRFVRNPMIYTRYLSWVAYKYDAKGYLHWAVDYYNSHSDPWNLGDNDNDAKVKAAGNTILFYPGYHTLYPSIRAAAQRDGFRDYELLKMVEARDAAKAKAFCDQAVKSISSYTTATSQFFAIRKSMLEYLSE